MPTNLQDLAGDVTARTFVVFILCGLFLLHPLLDAVNSHVNAQNGSLLYEIVLVASLWVATLPMLLVVQLRVWLFLMIAFSVFFPFSWLLKQRMLLWFGNAFLQWTILEVLCDLPGMVAGGLLSLWVFKRFIGPRTVRSEPAMPSLRD